MYRKILIGGATAAVVLGAGTAALATTGSSSTTSGTPVSATAPAKAGKHHHRSALSRAAHAQITVKTKNGYVTRDLINGTVTAVSPTSITVQAGDKTSETYAVTSATKVVARSATKGVKPAPSSIAKVAKGQHVVVTGTGTTTFTATRIVELAK